MRKLSPFILVTVTGLLTMLVSGCVSEVPPEAAEETAEVALLEPVWAQRLDPDYFEYETLEAVKLDMPASKNEPDATAAVTIPAGVAYLSVKVTFYWHDESITILGDWPTVLGEWENGTPAFEIQARFSCGNIPPAGYCPAPADQVILPVPPDGPDLQVTLTGWEERLYADVLLERATPVAWDGGDPPYVKRLDPDYFESGNATTHRLDFPQTPMAERPILEIELPEGQEFLSFHVQFFHLHPVGSAWTSIPSSNTDGWPTVIAAWDTGASAFTAPADRWSLGIVVVESESDGGTHVGRVPDGAKTLTLSSKGWGDGTYAKIDMAHAQPIAPF